MIHYKDFDFEGYKPSYYIKNKGKKIKGVSIEETICDDIITLDTEVTSYYIHNNKAMSFDYSKTPEWYREKTIPQSLMYIWMVGINYTKKVKEGRKKVEVLCNDVIYGRTNEELKYFIAKLTTHIQHKTIIYVHNLGYDFNFLQNSLGTNCSVFARKERKPITVTYPEHNLEFRCSLFLTNKSLKDSMKDLNAPVDKLEGDLDYNVLRTPLTKLTDKEMKYCEHDILCMYYILEDKLKKYKHVENIPMTQTGQVRRAFKAAMWSDKEYKAAVQDMWPDFKQFKLLAECFYGGYVHSNAKHTNKILKNVFSYDITSSYPYVLCTQKFPIKKFLESYEKNLNHLDFENYSYIMDITLTNVKSRLDNTFLSLHKALKVDYDGTDIVYSNSDKETNVVIDNGRIREAKKARYILTDCDIMILNSAYTFEYKINTIYTAPKDYLPTNLINFILKLFSDKTQYKDLDEFTSKYKESKEFINSVYGMFVTKILSDEITFTQGKWLKLLLNDSEDLKEEDKLYMEKTADEILTDLIEKDQICSYSTGVWCAAYARKHLWDIIVKMDKDVVYCDTDSIKFVNESNFKHFELDNKYVDIAIASVCLLRDIDPRLFKVTAPNGKIAKLGYFEAEKPYAQFKTLGAKKYAYILQGDKEKKVYITVAGVNKLAGAKYFKNLKQFAPATYLDYEFAGKNEVRYNSEQINFTFEDGYTATEKYGCVLKPTTYLLNITTDYNMLIKELEMLEGYETIDNFNLGEGTELL